MLEDERETVATEASRLAQYTPGRTGNLSVRRDDRVAITPSGVPYREIGPADVPVIARDGERLAGDREPSSEFPLHRAIYDAFETGAIAHAHSPWATTLAVLREPLPPVHYVIALAGRRVPVADYATYGTEALGEHAVAAMASADSRACLLANHGLVTTAADAASAIELVVAVESVARAYVQASAIGSPEPLPEAELERVAEKFRTYGPES